METTRSGSLVWLIAFLVLIGPSTLMAAPSMRAPIKVAVSYFDNNTGDASLAPLAKGLADMLITDLSNVGSIQIVERAKLNQALSELKLSQSKFIDPATAQRLGKGLAAQVVMTGGFMVVGETLRIDARVFEVESSAVLASQHVEGPKQGFFALEKDLVDVLIRALELKLADADRSKLRANATQSFAAWADYSSGLDAEDRGDMTKAQTAFERALAADPNYKSARNATERLGAIFSHRQQATVAQIDRDLQSLNPRSRAFNVKVDKILASLDDTRTAQLQRKLDLLLWLGQHHSLITTKAKVMVAPGKTRWVTVSSQATAVLGVAFREAEDPTQWETVPKVCEYFIHRFPDANQMITYCETLMSALNGRKTAFAAGHKAIPSWTVSEATRKFDEEDNEHRAMDGDNWMKALSENRERMRTLMQLYAHEQEP